LIALLISLPALGTYGQQTGEVTGTVTDATGALVAGATVTAANTNTQQVRTAASNDTGTYSLPFLQPGVYNLRAEKAGFKVIEHPAVTVQVGDVARIDFTMEVGTVSQNVVVNTGEPHRSRETSISGKGNR
jgi:protocatechuate 3,4-dioxygenase beta subunit